MQVNGAENVFKYHPVKENHPGHKCCGKEKQADIAEQKSVVNTEQRAATAEAAAVENAEQERSGVIRNLLAGHYKGVADIRLRINFADKIEQLNRNETAALAEQANDSINGDLNAEIGTFASSAELNDTQNAELNTVVEQFTRSLDSAFANFTSGEKSDNDTLLGSVQGAFEEFRNSLETLWDEEDNAPSGGNYIEEPVGSEVVQNDNPIVEEEIAGAGENEAGPAVDLKAETASFIDNFTGTFEDWFTGLQDSLESAPVLPEISQPHDNGVAFDKFMAIYNSLKGDETQPEGVTEP